ncbi:WG repeat-containing protein [Sphingobacterium sp. WM]|uniref:WG repeat-containing protein n=1 Tax=Sphingobacterium sp. WM TaxID=3031802 RepID=UPI00240D604A|nr:WG repeat-containing protein [Sphingobacterium sp. WM]WFB64898.1 WG repeat-containing protein [Sphingobacterium sp. WM]
MKKLFISILFLCMGQSTLLAQNQKVHKIDYQSFSSEQDMDKLKPTEDFFLRVWLNDNFIKITKNEATPSFLIINKSNNQSYYLFTESEEYYKMGEGSTFETQEDLVSIETVPGKTKTILGMPCKLAIATMDFETEENQNLKIEIWYTEKLPKLYWSEFSFLKDVPGALMALSVDGNGFIANKIKQETLPTSEFEIPTFYSELQVDTVATETWDEGDELISEEQQVDTDRFLYQDEDSELMGLKDENGNIITEAIYGYVDQFMAGISTVINADSKYGAIDKNGNIKIPFKYDFLAYDQEYQQYIYAEGDKFGILAANDQPIIKAQYDMVSHMSHGYLTATIGEKTGILDKTGKEIVPISYPLIIEFNAEVFVTADENYYQLYNIKNNKKIATGYNLISLSESEPIHLVQKGEKFGYINNQGKIVIPIKFSSGTTFDDGTASVMDSDDDDAYFINSKGEKVEID